MPLTKKEIAVSFQSLVVSGKIREAYDEYVHAEFRHHNPYFKGDRGSLLKAMEENAKQFPNKTFEVKRVLEDGDLVAVHSRLKLRPDMPEMAVIHIFQFKDGKIIEEWDVGQQVPEQNINEHGMF